MLFTGLLRLQMSNEKFEVVSGVLWMRANLFLIDKGFTS